MARKNEAKNQHTVTKQILREFVDDYDNDEGKLSVFEKARRQRQLRTPGSGVFKTTFDAYAPNKTEGFWNQFETKFPQILTRIRNRDDAPFVGADADLIRDMVAVHWLRSRAIMNVRDTAGETVYAKLHARLMTEQRSALALEFMRRTGNADPSPTELADMGWRLIEESRQTVVPKHHHDKNREYFADARKRVRELHLSIRYTASGDLAIGDAPVITTIGDDPRAAGPHQNVGILKTDYVAMPLGPHALAVLTERTDNSELGAADVVRCNELQWSTFLVWIAAKPDAFADQRLQSEANKPSTTDS